MGDSLSRPVRLHRRTFRAILRQNSPIRSRIEIHPSVFPGITFVAIATVGAVVAGEMVVSFPPIVRGRFFALVAKLFCYSITHTPNPLKSSQILYTASLSPPEEKSCFFLVEKKIAQLFACHEIEWIMCCLFLGKFRQKFIGAIKACADVRIY